MTGVRCFDVEVLRLRPPFRQTPAPCLFRTCPSLPRLHSSLGILQIFPFMEHPKFAGKNSSNVPYCVLRATTRKAEWENIHWTGRTDIPFTCQGRRITSNVSGSAKPPTSTNRSHSCFTWVVEGR